MQRYHNVSRPLFKTEFLNMFVLQSHLFYFKASSQTRTFLLVQDQQSYDINQKLAHQRISKQDYKSDQKFEYHLSVLDSFPYSAQLKHYGLNHKIDV